MTDTSLPDGQCRFDVRQKDGSFERCDAAENLPFDIPANGPAPAFRLNLCRVHFDALISQLRERKETEIEEIRRRFKPS
jgi:hypothetical protein